ncbi:MAG: sodium:proton antiporter NhaD [Bernardetiaceae bacterium]|jgi:Na+/H+ antiporter NhaD/arsenite permease-like protein|nr:sodium:proton antiporter NhaD [Bernardetiaceae bacterium]
MTFLLIALFVIGYLAIAFEHPLQIDKAPLALVTGILCWTIYVLMSGTPAKDFEHQLLHHFSEIASILFFLLGAMTIVELVDAHQGFQIVTDRIRTTNLTALLWIVGLLAFFLSAVLDNLTTTIVMTSILRKLIPARALRLYFVSLVVIAANAGGAWSPIGDVTTTMLWIGGQVTTTQLFVQLILPSLVCLVVPVLIFSVIVKRANGPVELTAGAFTEERLAHDHPYHVSPRLRNLLFFTGVGALLFVPIFKTVTHLPPFMGMMLSLGVVWMVTELAHRAEERAVRDPLSVVNLIRRIDVPSVLFFLGILLAVSCLQTVGLLGQLAGWLDRTVGNPNLIAVLLGGLSAVVDNVPLVAGAMGMYNLTTFPQDHFFWHMVAFCAGTGGSCLIIGSAAGVAAMGMERIEFGWYTKHVAWVALVGYLAGVGVLLLVGG